MLINKVIVHELVKDQHRPISDSNYRPLLLDNSNELVLKLVSGINKIYGNRYNSAYYGIFANGAPQSQTSSHSDSTDKELLKDLNLYVVFTPA